MRAALLRTPTGRLAACAGGAIAIGLFAGCAGPSEPPPSQPGAASTPPASSQALPPIFVDLTADGGKSISLPLDRALVVKTGDETPEAWIGKAAQPGIVRFEPGGKRDGAEFNPGWFPESIGTTEVTMTNPDADTSVTFTIKVIP